MTKIDYGEGVWVSSFVEFACYKDVVLVGEAKLTPTTKLSIAYTGDIQSGAGTQVNLNVVSTGAFDDYGTAYIDEIEFDYGNKTSTSFLHCSGAGIYSASAVNTRISQDIETTTLLYDDDNLLEYLGDKLYKNTDLNVFLDTQTRCDKRAGDYLTEYLKNHTKATITGIYAPHIRVGQTLLVTDNINKINRRYFVDSLQSSNDRITLAVAYYP